MNIELLTQIADTLDSLADPSTQTEIGFFLGAWFNSTAVANAKRDTSGHSCGTVACIAGWGAYLHFNRNKTAAEYKAMDMREIMGLSYKQFIGLCVPPLTSYESVTPAEAAKVIRHLVETGTVDWKIAGHNPVSPESPDVL